MPRNDRLPAIGIRFWLGLLAIMLPVPIVTRLFGQDKQPYYVGARVCGSCHSGKGIGDQFGLWLLSKHAQAYALLSRLEAGEIVRLSGITQEPQVAPICLGCHSTAAEAEKWEKDPTFFAGDGVQCEKCHGPGSEYANAKVMMDRKTAMEAGLKMPARRDCMICHSVKGSHVAVHKRAQINIEDAWKMLAHPIPKNWTPPQPESTSGKRPPSVPGPKYIGVEACFPCHSGLQTGYQFSRWRLTAHARAYATLSTPAAQERAKQQGLTEEPQNSAACLKCHATVADPKPGSFLSSFSPSEGVGCEACHGAGSEYSLQAIMLDKGAAKAAGLKPVARSTCLACHENAHGKPFDFDRAWKEIEHPSRPQKIATGASYKTPLRLALRPPDGRQLFVTCESAGSVIVVDVQARKKVGEIPVGGQPTDITFSPDGRLGFVTNRLDDSVSVIDVEMRKVVRTFRVGDEPHGLLIDGTGKHLFVLNTAADSISVLDADSGKEIKRLTAGRAPWSIAGSPDGKRMFITNNLSRFVPFRTPALSEITVLDSVQMAVSDRLVAPEANYLQGIAWHPSGEFAFCTLMRTKNLVPMTRVIQGWTITNGLGIIWEDGTVDQVLLDEANACFADPTGVAFSADGKRALVTSSGTNQVAVIDVPALIGMLRAASRDEREGIIPNHLGKAAGFVIKHIPTRDSPRGVIVTPDGEAAFVANSLDDSLTVIDMQKLQTAGMVDLGGPQEITEIRAGERLFHSARVTFQRQFSCHSCHPDGHVNGLTFDIEPDGIGISPVDNRTLRGILDTAPFKWEGTNPSLSHECGPRLAVFFTRIQPFTPDQLAALVRYISTISRPPNRYRAPGAELTEAQARDGRFSAGRKRIPGKRYPSKTAATRAMRGRSSPTGRCTMWGLR